MLSLAIDVASWVSPGDCAALDALVEAGVHATREEAAAWLIHAGVQANTRLIARVNDLIVQMRQLRETAQSLTQQAESAPDKPARDA